MRLPSPWLLRRSDRPGFHRPAFNKLRRRRLFVERLEERNLLTFYGGYRTVDELYASIADVANNYPDITEVVDYGQSYSKLAGGVITPGGDFLAGYDLLALHITNKAIPGPKPASFVVAGIHSREISTPEVIFKYVDYLTQNYGSDPDVTWMIDYHDLWVVPMANPDGHWYVELGTQPPYSGNPWYWRKNGDPNACPHWPGNNGDSYGTDLNRNFDDHWGSIGASSDPCSEIYHGPFVNSEPETVALQNLVSSVIPVQKGPNDNDPAPEDTTGIYIDVHTYGGYVLWPWGHTPTPPPNSVGLTAIGKKFATYNNYIAGQSYQTLYPTSGVSPGYVYGKLGAPAYTIELNSSGFLPPLSTVQGLWMQNKGALLYAAKSARTPYMTVHGPDSLQLATSLDASTLTITGTINDTKNGNQAIVAAEYYVDTPPWVDGATPIAMEASDGDFDMPVENVDASQSTDGLDPGRHIVYVRGLEATGNWGPVTAAFFDLQKTAGATGSSSHLPKNTTGIVAAVLIMTDTAPVGMPFQVSIALDGILTPAGTGSASAILDLGVIAEPVGGQGLASSDLANGVLHAPAHHAVDQLFVTGFQHSDELANSLALAL